MGILQEHNRDNDDITTNIDVEHGGFIDNRGKNGTCLRAFS